MKQRQKEEDNVGGNIVALFLGGFYYRIHHLICGAFDNVIHVTSFFNLYTIV